MRKQVVLSVFGALAMSSCSSGGGGQTPAGVVTASPIVRTFVFPQGDAKTPMNGTAFDIIQVKTTLSSEFYNANHDAYDYLTIATTFAQDISSAFPGPLTAHPSVDQLAEVVAFNTGGTAIFPDCASLTARNSYASIANTDSNDNYPIDGSNAVLLNSVNGSVLTQSVPLGGINVHSGPNIPHIGITVSVSNGGQDAFFTSDCASINPPSLLIGT